jgi:hypothetical protein
MYMYMYMNIHTYSPGDLVEDDWYSPYLPLPEQIEEFKGEWDDEEWATKKVHLR